MANMHAVFAGHMVCYAVQVSDEQGVSRGSVKAAGRTTGRQVAALACVEALILSVACLYGASVVPRHSGVATAVYVAFVALSCTLASVLW